MNCKFRTLIFLLIIALQPKLSGQIYETKFETYTHLNGLSNSHVNCIIQDANGFMWFGTDYGLNKFDGYNFTKYITSLSENSLPSNEVSALYIDNNGYLWVGTFNGLARFDHVADKFHTFFINQDSIQYYKPVRAIVGDNSGRIMVGTSGNGVLVIDEEKGTGIDKLTSQLKENIGEELVYALLIDKKNNLWVGTEENGVKVYNLNTGDVKHFTTQNSILRSNSILTLFEDKYSNIWIGTRGGGLSIYRNSNNNFDKSIAVSNIEDEIYSFTYNADSLLWIGTNDGGLIVFDHETKVFSKNKTYAAEKDFRLKRIRALFTDNEKNTWLGIHQLGISIVKNYDYPFQKQNIILPKEIDIAKSSILGLILDTKENLWLGTDGHGLIKYNIKTEECVHYRANRTNPKAILDNVIRTVYEDSKNNIWIGTYKGGLSKYIESGDYFKNYVFNPSDLLSIPYNDVVAITEDKEQNLWIATNGGGLCLFNYKDETFTRYSTTDRRGKSTICSDWLTCLFPDSKGHLWIGSYWGLSKFDIENYTFKNYYFQKDNKNSLSSNIIFAINEDEEGHILIGTKNGLNILNPESDEFKYRGFEDGLAGEVVNTIIRDNNNNFWLGTNNGLSFLDYEKIEFENYFFEDGLSSNEFIHNSASKTSDGMLLFGSVFGFNTFIPDSIPEIEYFPKVTITDFKIFNKSVPIGKLYHDKIILQKSISETKEINLDYSDNSFSFDFVALNFSQPEKIMYACKMEGFEEKWTYQSNNRRFITYTNLDPGNYSFLVKASSKNGKWSNEVTKVNIFIAPPIWRTKWAYFIYIVLFIGSTFLIIRSNSKRLERKNQRRMERLKQEQAELLNQSKLEFFTNISHEFRTPLTLILGPIDNLLGNEKLGKPIKQTLMLMSRNANRLLRLVNQLLDLRKVEKGKLKLNAKETDAIHFFKEIFQSFEELAERKAISYSFSSSSDKIMMYIDADKVDKILFNLLSNAFKFTPDNGNIKLSINTSESSKKFPEGSVLISVEDNGQGMSEEHVKRIFERFYQTGYSDSIQKGSGIGLSLTKSLVEIHYGHISVISRINEGSIFTIELPLGKSHLKEDEIVEINEFETVDSNIQPTEIDDYENTFEQNTKIDDNDESAPLLLLVEDNADVRLFLRNGLQTTYRIAEAENGKEGLKKTLELMPDLIISDIMMPVMDGITFCKKIKTDLVTCHIPVILLTAKSSIEHRIEGLETGADSYIPKPFNTRHLLIRIKKLIELREKLKSKFKNEADFEPVEMAVTSADEKFLKKAVEVIKEKISDTELNVENLGKEIGMDRSHLYRKLKALVGQSPSEFIRTIRLKQAAHLLANEDIPVSEISYLVGFNSPSYFTSSFSKMYKVSPTQYKEKHFKA